MTWQWLFVTTSSLAVIPSAIFLFDQSGSSSERLDFVAIRGGT